MSYELEIHRRNSGLEMRLFKIRLPPAETPELGRTYDVLFNELSAGWAGRIGHYGYGDDLHIAQNQDGYIYCFKREHYWQITCDCGLFSDRHLIPEVTPDQLSAVIAGKNRYW